MPRAWQGTDTPATRYHTAVRPGCPHPVSIHTETAIRRTVLPRVCRNLLLLHRRFDGMRLPRTAGRLAVSIFVVALLTWLLTAPPAGAGNFDDAQPFAAPTAPARSPLVHG